MGRSIRIVSVSSAYRKQLNGKEKEESKSGPVVYDSTDWHQVLFQCFGSAWPKVIPYCIGNVLLMIVVTLLKEYEIIDLSTSSKTHSLMGMVVSFLIVARVNTALSRYSVCRGDVNIMYREARQLIQNAIVLTNRHGNVDKKSREWRNEFTYRSLVLLRTSIAVVEYYSKGLSGWECPELSGLEAAYVTPSDLWKCNSSNNDHGNDYCNTMRVPFRIEYLLRKTVVEQNKRLVDPLDVRHESKFLNGIDSFMVGFHGVTKFITTPVPFPLIQMTRTIILIYIYTIPLILLKIEGTKDFSEEWVWNCISTFILTYGFMGLELVAIELDDPFGDDENDFDTLAFARMVFEDTYLLISEADGEEWANKLRKKMGCQEGPRNTSFSSFNFGSSSS